MSIHGNWITFRSSTGALGGSFLSGTVRPPPLRHYRDQFNHNAAWFGITTSPFLRDWYRPFSEPGRRKPPLPRGAIPSLFSGIGYTEYSFAITEPGDSASLSFSVYVAKNLARVTITELETYPTRVTIREINYGRGYS